MRPAAQEAALQLVLRDGSKEIVGEGQHVRSWGRRDSEQLSSLIKAFVIGRSMYTEKIRGG